MLFYLFLTNKDIIHKHIYLNTDTRIQKEIRSSNMYYSNKNSSIHISKFNDVHVEVNEVHLDQHCH
jgi:hypothetical protein